LIQIKPGKAGTRLLEARFWPLSFSDLFPMSSELSLGPAVDPPQHREETLQVAAVLAFASGAPALALGIPVIVLLVVLLRCETERMMGRFP
jgi:hypothetical protein